MKKTHKRKARAEGEAVEQTPARTEDPATRDLLDEIDGVLEENYEQFVENYEAKGGE